jgi:hypothetical protein
MPYVENIPGYPFCPYYFENLTPSLSIKWRGRQKLYRRVKDYEQSGAGRLTWVIIVRETIFPETGTQVRILLHLAIVGCMAEWSKAEGKPSAHVSSLPALLFHPGKLIGLRLNDALATHTRLHRR